MSSHTVPAMVPAYDPLADPFVPILSRSAMTEAPQTATARARGSALVAVGLFARVAAAVLANENLSGDAAQLEWVQAKALSLV